MDHLFDWLKDSGTQAILVLAGTCAAIVAAVAAIWTLIYSKDAPTKEDLQRVEDNTATTASHVEKVRSHMANVDVRQQEQHEEELMREAARHISIFVQGVLENTSLMTLRFTVHNPTVVLLRAQLRNELGPTFAQADCARQGQQEFSADFQFLDIQKWYDSATTFDMRGRRVLTIRTQLQFGRQDAERDITAWVERSQSPLFKVDGNC
jgi:hypothetical protein